MASGWEPRFATSEAASWMWNVSLGGVVRSNGIWTNWSGTGVTRGRKKVGFAVACL